jgi:hypothetical protein
VRGRVLGSECLAEALGSDTPPEIPETLPAGDGRRTVAGAAFAVAALSTILPWSTFGEGAGPFGAWGRSPRWSLLAALASLAGLGLWLVLRRRRSATPAGDAALAVLGALVAFGGGLTALRPPYAAHVSLTPWIAAAAGIVALVASLLARRTHAGGSGGSV